MTRSADTEALKTTRRSFEIINTVQDYDGATLDEIADQLNLAKSTVHKHVTVLRDLGYLDHQGREYYIGLKFLYHGEYARAHKQSFRIAREKINELARKTEAESDFVVENSGRGLSVHESYLSERPWHKSILDDDSRSWRSGTYYHLHCIASGKAILADLPEQRVEEIIDQWDLPERTEYTITEREELYDELEQIRKRGHAVSEDEYARGLSAVGMTVDHPHWGNIGAISVSFPTYRLQKDELDEIILPALDETVEAVESECCTVEDKRD